MTESVDLDALEALHAKATPTLWFVDEYDALQISDRDCGAVIATAYEPHTEEEWAGDRDLIVAAVNALPSLVRELREARAEIERVRAEHIEVVKQLESLRLRVKRALGAPVGDALPARDEALMVELAREVEAFDDY